MELCNLGGGISNRRLLNRTFLAMLVEAGLDGALIDPTDRRIIETVYASRALLGRDNYCIQYIKQQRRRGGK